jgi:hypothetical protein
MIQVFFNMLRRTMAKSLQRFGGASRLRRQQCPVQTSITDKSKDIGQEKKIWGTTFWATYVLLCFYF